MKQKHVSTESTINEQKNKKTKKKIIISVGIATTIIGISSIIIVKEHIRNLPEGRHASKKQIELAKSRGLELDSNQTFIPSCPKRVS